MKLLWKLRLAKDTRGQDLIEYALIAGFIAVAAGAAMPGLSEALQGIFNRITGVLNAQTPAGS